MYNIGGVSKNFKKSQRSSSINDLGVNSFSETVQGGSHIAVSRSTHVSQSTETLTPVQNGAGEMRRSQVSVR